MASYASQSATMNLEEELRSAGVLPTGPVSAWPHDRHKLLMNSFNMHVSNEQNTSYSIGRSGDVVLSVLSSAERAQSVSAGLGTMAKGFVRAASQALVNGRVSEEIREERYNTCKSCPFFVEDSKRCSECGCFMEAKTWIGGDPDLLCPKRKWSR